MYFCILNVHMMYINTVSNFIFELCMYENDLNFLCIYMSETYWCSEWENEFENIYNDNCNCFTQVENRQIIKKWEETLSVSPQKFNENWMW